MRRTNRVLMALAMLTLAGATTLLAQGSRYPQERRGFWIGFGLGAGQASVDCDLCDVKAATGASGYLKLGGRIGRSLLLGGESNSWVGTIEDRVEGEADVVAGYVAATIYWYPTPTSGLFLKGGLGGFNLTGESEFGEDLESSSAAILLGVGYDFRIRRMASITPVLTILRSAAGDLDVDGFTATDDFTSTVIAVQVGITWH